MFDWGTLGEGLRNQNPTVNKKFSIQLRKVKERRKYTTQGSTTPQTCWLWEYYLLKLTTIQALKVNNSCFQNSHLLNLCSWKWSTRLQLMCLQGQMSHVTMSSLLLVEVRPPWNYLGSFCSRLIISLWKEFVLCPTWFCQTAFVRTITKDILTWLILYTCTTQSTQPLRSLSYACMCKLLHHKKHQH